jgi:pimeloyl-ACP methyl ester carboxylesterase
MAFLNGILEKIKSCMQVECNITYRTTQVDGWSIFYREAGPNDAPTILFLHDYPGFGYSDAPAPDRFEYTFDHLAEIIDSFTGVLGLQRYTLYMQDYGGPVGFRMAIAGPQKVERMIIQNAVALEEGLSALWNIRKAYWQDRAAHEDELRANFTSLEAIAAQGAVK